MLLAFLVSYKPLASMSRPCEGEFGFSTIDSFCGGVAPWFGFHGSRAFRKCALAVCKILESLSARALKAAPRSGPSGTPSNWFIAELLSPARPVKRRRAARMQVDTRAKRREVH